jgi:hypothetical protein
MAAGLYVRVSEWVCLFATIRGPRHQSIACYFAFFLFLSAHSASGGTDCTHMSICLTFTGTNKQINK